MDLNYYKAKGEVNNIVSKTDDVEKITLDIGDDNSYKSSIEDFITIFACYANSIEKYLVSLNDDIKDVSSSVDRLKSLDERMAIEMSQSIFSMKNKPKFDIDEIKNQQPFDMEKFKNQQLFNADGFVKSTNK